jgi:hypothetical protein
MHIPIKNGQFRPNTTWFFRSLAWFVASVVTAMIGPFTTYTAFDFPERFAYWASLIGVAILSGFAIRAAVMSVRRRDDLIGDLIGAVIQSVILGPLIWAVNFAGLGFRISGAVFVLEHVAVVFAVCLAVVCLRQYLRIAGAEPFTADTDPAPLAEPDPAFLKRLDAALGRDLMRVSAANHHLQVVTATGEGRVLMRFRDALQELAELPGYQIHRSHWVSRAALVRVRQDGRRHIAELSCGAELPVSRGYVDELRRDGITD